MLGKWVGGSGSWVSWQRRRAKEWALMRQPTGLFINLEAPGPLCAWQRAGPQHSYGYIQLNKNKHEVLFGHVLTFFSEAVAAWMRPFLRSTFSVAQLRTVIKNHVSRVPVFLSDVCDTGFSTLSFLDSAWWAVEWKRLYHVCMWRGCRPVPHTGLPAAEMWQGIWESGGWFSELSPGSFEKGLSQSSVSFEGIHSVVLFRSSQWRSEGPASDGGGPRSRGSRPSRAGLAVEARSSLRCCLRCPSAPLARTFPALLRTTLSRHLCSFRVRAGRGVPGNAVRNACLLREAAHRPGSCATRMKCGRARPASSACATVARWPAGPGSVPGWSAPRWEAKTRPHGL